MPDVRLPSFRILEAGSRPSRPGLPYFGHIPDLAASAYADPSSSPSAGRRQQALLPSEVAITISAVQPGGARASLPAQPTTSQLQGLRRFPSPALPSFPHQAPPPEPGSYPDRLRVRRSRLTSVPSGGSAPAFKTCRQLTRAGASVSACTSRKPNPGMQRTRCARR